MAAQLKTQHSLNAQKRVVLGRKIKKLRREGIVPANISGKDVKSQSVQVNLKEFSKVFTEAGETGLVSLVLDNEVYPVLIHNISLDAVTDVPLHVDFLQVNLKEKVTATVPIEFIGENPLEKTQEGIVVPQMREIEVEALPTELPEKIEVDISILTEVGASVKVADLKVDREKVELKEEDPERIVVTVEAPAKEEVVEAPAPVEGETPKGETPTGSEIPAEGGEAPKEDKEEKKE